MLTLPLASGGTIRQGECNHCGWCCQFLIALKMTVPLKDSTPEAVAFYTMRGGFVGDDGQIRIMAPSYAPCPHHRANRCSIYEARPAVCKNDFPHTPEQIEGTPCSYWFEETQANGVVERRGGGGSPYPTPPRFGVTDARYI